MYDDYNRREGGHGRGGQRGRRRGTPLSDLDPELTAISHKVIGLATEVHMELGPGYDESVYQEAFAIALKAEDIKFKSGLALSVYFDDEKVGEVTADLFIEDQFIVEVMAEPREISGYDRTKLRAQLRAADVVLGLVINFAGRRLKDGLVRVLNPDKLNEQREQAEHDEDDEHDDDHDHDDDDGGEYEEDES
jgi:GxxExxY protein